ncbi:hypothetical protein PSENEW3_00001642 [Picochlorum sp. SENEW3]|nr:hypothetical protein PSENEW3_00001642 [Picochlorum sp. SENEW3]
MILSKQQQEQQEAKTGRKYEKKKVNTQQGLTGVVGQGTERYSTMVYDDAHVLDSLSMASMALEAKNRMIERLQEELERLQRGTQQDADGDVCSEAAQHQVLRGEKQQVDDILGHAVMTRSLVERRDSHDSTSSSGRRRHHSLVLLLQETLDELHTSRVTIEKQSEEMERLKGRLDRVQGLVTDGEMREHYEALLEEKDRTIAELASMLASRDAFAENVRVFLQQHASSLPSSPTSSI